MKARIKIVERRNGTKEYYPQIYRSHADLVFSILSLPIRLWLSVLATAANFKLIFIRYSAWAYVVKDKYNEYDDTSYKPKKPLRNVTDAEEYICGFCRKQSHSERWMSLYDAVRRGKKVKSVTYVEYP